MPRVLVNGSRLQAFLIFCYDRIIRLIECRNLMDTRLADLGKPLIPKPHSRA